MKGRPAPEPQPAAPDLEGLADFAVSTDRDEPVKFVGRVKQIATLKRSLEVGLEHWRRGKPIAWKGASWLFQGAPGAGKTALLSHLGSLKIEDRTTGKHVEHSDPVVPGVPDRTLFQRTVTMREPKG